MIDRAGVVVFLTFMVCTGAAGFVLDSLSARGVVRLRRQRMQKGRRGFEVITNG